MLKLLLHVVRTEQELLYGTILDWPDHEECSCHGFIGVCATQNRMLNLAGNFS